MSTPSSSSSSLPPSILKKSKSIPPIKTPTTSQTAEAHLLESQLPLPPKKERKPKRSRPDSAAPSASSSKRPKKEDVPELPFVEGKKAEKKRLRAEAQALRPAPPVEENKAEPVKPLVWDTEKNGRNPYEDERLGDAAKKGESRSSSALLLPGAQAHLLPLFSPPFFVVRLPPPLAAIAYSQTIQNTYLKFQKARQNFLLRHIYNENEIPEEYLPLVLAYLKTVKGGSRDSLIASANLILNPPPAPTPAAPTTAVNDAEPTPVADASAVVEPEVVEEEEEETEEEKEVKRSRAKALLEILGETVESAGEKKKKGKKEKKSKKEVEEAEAEAEEVVVEE
ncbi:hypothetical protein BDY24DRAFT_180684 [Mrakia frigida]|uniref:uncharacterized protein n=1 Tax=Mrakia frigida TaxID=29902 RepID=UPI003FCC24BC